MCFCIEPKDRIRLLKRGKWGQDWVSSHNTSAMGLINSTALLYSPEAIHIGEFDAHGRKTSRPRQSHLIKLKLKPRSLSDISSVIPILALEPSASRTGQGGSRLLPDSWKLV
jgi:hypothetical protein